MIANHFRPCCICRKQATRLVQLDADDVLKPLCFDCPTPDEIRQRAADLRSAWSEVDYMLRSCHFPRSVRGPRGARSSKLAG